MMNFLRKHCLLGCVGALVLIVSGSASATVLYQDNFDGAGSTLLNGTTPDVTTDGNVWAAATNYEADGTVIGDTGEDYSSGAWLPVTVEAGHTYVLSAAFTVPYAGGTASQNKDWIAVGFTSSGNTSRAFNTDGGFGTVLFRENGNMTIYAGSGTAGGTAYEDPTPYVGATGNISVVITLDATDALASNWTIAFEVNGVSVQGPTAASSNSYGGIDYLGFSHTRADGELTSLTFEVDPTPEPASLTLLGFGFAALAAKRCRRR